MGQAEPGTDATDRDRLRADIDRWYRWSNRGSKLGGAFLNILLFGSIILTSAATIIAAGKLSVWGFEPTTISAILTGVATIFTGFLTTGGIERKWRTNRRTRGELEKLRIYFNSSNADIIESRKWLLKIISDHEDGIQGSSGDPHKKQ
jgi:hypothetical protein